MNSEKELKVSIIIPCYKTENTLEETLISVSKLNYSNWEAIMVNDGSPDNLEDNALRWVDKDPRFKYFKKTNGGLGSARNFGIEKATGDFILPLDSDNMVRPNYITKSMAIFKKNPKLAVVYGNAQKFGALNKLWRVGKFDKYKMLSGNYIDACAVIRKNALDEVGLYETKMPYQGHEDWELWIRLMTNGFEFHYLKEICFDYRVTKTSMINSFSKDMLEANYEYMHNKYSKIYIEYFYELQQERNALRFFTNNFLIRYYISAFLSFRKKMQKKNSK
jgi:glycosyltransferase involved in cell wall biosynthesis